MAPEDGPEEKPPVETPPEVTPPVEPAKEGEKPADAPDDMWRRNVLGKDLGDALHTRKKAPSTDEMIGQMFKVSEKEKNTFTTVFKNILEKETYKNLEFDSVTLLSVLINPNISKDFDIQNPETIEAASKAMCQFMIMLLGTESLSEDKILIKGEEGKAILAKLKKNGTWRNNFITFSYKANKLTIFYQEPGKEKQTLVTKDLSDEVIKENLTKFMGMIQKFGTKPEEGEETDAPAGKLHGIYETAVDKVPEETAKTDLDTVTKVDTAELRKNPRILKKVEGEEADEVKVTNLKEEAARRIRAFTSNYKGGWYTMDYSKADSAREAGLPSHESHTGIGEVFGVDPDNEELIVKRTSGRLIRCHLGTVPSGRHKGRIAYLDKNEKYVATNTGDQVKLLSDNVTDTKDVPAVKKYIEKFVGYNKGRDEHYTFYQEGLKQTEPSLTTSTVTYKAPETKIEGSTITVQRVRDAEKEASTGTTIDNVLEKRPNFMAVVNYAAKEVGIPPWVLLGVMFHESRFNYLVSNKEHQGERGIGQFKAAAWDSVKKDEKFTTPLKQIMDVDPSTIARQSSILADVIGIAIFTKRAIPGVTHLTHLNQEQLEDIRWRYHVPGYRNALKNGKGSEALKEKARAFMASKKAKDGEGSIYGYKYFANTCLSFEKSWKAKYGATGEKAD